MKQLLLTLLCVITIAGCNNTTEPVIPDAVTYTSIEYMPIDTSIKYVYKDGGKDTTYRIHVYDMENYPQLYHKYNVEGEVKKYRYEYQLKIGYWDSFHLTAMGVENTNAGTEIAISAYGNAEHTR